MAKAQTMDPLTAAEATLAQLRARRDPLQAQRLGASETLQTAFDARRKMLLDGVGVGNDRAAAADQAITNAEQSVRGLDDAIGILDQQIAEAELAVEAQVERKHREFEATGKRELADRIEKTADAYYEAAKPFQAAVEQAGGLSLGPGASEQVQITINEIKRAVEQITTELRFAATLLADPNISRRQLQANGIIPHDPSAPLPAPEADPRAGLRMFDPSIDRPHPTNAEQFGVMPEPRQPPPGIEQLAKQAKSVPDHGNETKRKPFTVSVGVQRQ
jgi:hypothetical protein